MAISKQDWPDDIRQAARVWSSETHATKRRQDDNTSRLAWSNDGLYGRRRKERMRMVETYGKVLKLHESNFPTWIKMMEKLLRECGLWTGVRYPRKPYIKLSEQQQDENECKDVWAVNIMLMHINPYYLARQPIDKPVTGHDLLRQLEKGARPLRFLDLPRELRYQVYEYAIPAGKERQEFVHANYRFEVTLLDHHGPEALEEWVTLVGLRPLQYVRDLKVIMSYYRDSFDTVHVTCSPGSGLKAKVKRYRDWADILWTDKPQAHATSIEERKRREGWNGTGIVEFFTTGADGLREAIYGPWVMGDDEEEETNERDAYQVAYGKRQVEIYGGCPW
ncbi:hypothetical protein LTR37_019061 [Vermiconidia calcicola]|uniref:Uncharacterized protein n=1 Tax=Vermiconidia calcicola TaxID=1690605 RepID=A0ACC3MGZ7_9PEZI|nr:hypothetical protein LTR37_019061 [Vermiconidia calcicola]